ncbi:MAG: hypothetical protein KKE23_03935 [Nanoarchaeota archaeon]|nr:hypothetical protein [Nanoarchaeota archaeon]
MNTKIVEHVTHRELLRFLKGQPMMDVQKNEIREHLRSCPECSKKGKYLMGLIGLVHYEAYLKKTTEKGECPSIETLKDYAEEKITKKATIKELNVHLLHCKKCDRRYMHFAVAFEENREPALKTRIELSLSCLRKKVGKVGDGIREAGDRISAGIGKIREVVSVRIQLLQPAVAHAYRGAKRSGGHEEETTEERPIEIDWEGGDLVIDLKDKEDNRMQGIVARLCDEKGQEKEGKVQESNNDGLVWFGNIEPGKYIVKFDGHSTEKGERLAVE